MKLNCINQCYYCKIQIIKKRKEKINAEENLAFNILSKAWPLKFYSHN